MKTSLGFKLCSFAALALWLALPAAASELTMFEFGDSTKQCNTVMGDGPFSANKEPAWLGPARPKIRNGPCSWCNSNSSCSQACIDDNGNQSDCGDYGVCDPCREGIVEIGRQVIGLSATRKWVTLCEYKTHSLVTYKSVNAGCQPFTVCETDKETHTVIGVPCCAIAPGCFGTSC